MDRAEFDAWEDRIRARAHQMWLDAGSPEGAEGSFTDAARELIAIEEVPAATLDPNAAPVPEEAALQRNLGEFPTLVDQGEEQTFPDEDPGDDEIALSDGDAADQGGVMPDEGGATGGDVSVRISLTNTRLD